jgi:hypothetical protein
LVPFFPRSVGFLPTFFPPEPGFAQPPVGGLPVPVDPAEFVTLGDENFPDPLDHTTRAPALEPVVNGALGTELARQLVPLATGTHAEDDAVEAQPPVGVTSTRGFARPESVEDRLDPLPEIVGDFPDGRERLVPGSPFPPIRWSSHPSDPP